MKTFILILSSLVIVTSGLAVDTNAVTLKEVAGDYYFGDGLGVNCTLKLSSQGRFTFKWTGCLGTYDQNEGGATLKGGVLRLTPKKANVREGLQGTPTEFFPVRWGARLYLIATNEMVEFCSEVNQGGEPRNDIHGQNYLRAKDADKPLRGRPALPEPWNKYILTKPVRGTITELINSREAWFDRGAASGLLEGMILTAQPHGDLKLTQVRVVAVEPTRCRIECKWEDRKLGVGQTVTSRFH